MKNFNALIFAAGLGTRLKPFTERHPKALAPVGGKVMLERVIRKVTEAGARRIVVNVHHFSSQIVEFLEAHNNFGADIAVSDESELLLDTGGGLLKALEMVDSAQPLLLHNADILCDADLGAMLERHTETGADATLLVSDRKTSRSFLFDNAGRLRGWKNHATGETRPEWIDSKGLYARAFNGIHFVNPTTLLEPLRREAETAGRVFSITPFYAGHSQELDIRGYAPTPEPNWLDIGKPESLAKANALFEK